MKLTMCKLCGKAFPSNGPTTCPQCIDDLDVLYRQVREFLRENPKKALNSEEMAEELGIDIRRVQALVEMGYLERNVVGDAVSEKDRKQDLVRKLQASLSKSAEASRESSSRMYAQDKYGDKGRGK